MGTFKNFTAADVKASPSSLNQLIDVIQEDVSGSLTRRKYEVFVTSPKNSKEKGGGIAGTVALASLAGPDLAGDAVLIQGQKKQTAIQEWNQWKQWALDHKEFPKFQTDFLNVVHEYNKNIDKNFEDPEYQKNVLNPLLQRYENRLGLFKRLIMIVLGLAIIGNIYIYLEDNSKGWNKQNIERYK